MAHQTGDENMSFQKSEGSLPGRNEEESSHTKKKVLSNVAFRVNDTTIDYESISSANPDLLIESNQELVGATAKYEDNRGIANLTDTKFDIRERVESGGRSNFNDGSTIADRKLSTLSDLQDLQSNLLHKHRENDTHQIISDNNFVQEVSTVHKKDSNLEKTVFNISQNELQETKCSNSSVRQCTDETSSTSRQISITDKMNEKVLCFSSQDQSQDTSIRSINQDQETVSNCSPVRKRSKPSFMCKSCYKFFPSDYALKCHMAGIHSIGDYKCGVCEKIFANSDNLKTHMSLHTLGYFTCCVCNDKFKEKSELESHKNLRHPKAACHINCRICKENKTLL